MRESEGPFRGAGRNRVFGQTPRITRYLTEEEPTAIPAAKPDAGTAGN